jgi:hypothetical protein
MDFTRLMILSSIAMKTPGNYGAIAIDTSDVRSNDPLVRLDDFGVSCESFATRLCVTPSWTLPEAPRILAS